MAAQTYSPYRRSGQAAQRTASVSQAVPARRSGLSQAILAAQPAPSTPVRHAASVRVSGTRSGLADPVARRWVVFGAIGVVTSLLLTVAVALLSTRGVASADVPPAEQSRPSRITLVREIGGAQRSPTPGAGQTATAPADAGAASVAEASGSSSVASVAVRQLRRVGRAMVTVDGIRRLALGGALPFLDGNAPATAQHADGVRSVALAPTPTTDDPAVTLEAGSIFLRIADTATNALAQVGRSEAVVLASPITTPSARITTAQMTPTLVPAIATSTAARSTPVPAAATAVPPTQTPVIITATPVPATQTPVVVTATPDWRRRAPEVIVVTVVPAPIQYPNGSIPYPSGSIPHMQQPAPQAVQPRVADPAAIVSSIPGAYAPVQPAPAQPVAGQQAAVPPTAVPTHTAVPTATPQTAPTVRATSTLDTSTTASAPSAPASAPRRSESTPAAPVPAGPAPILAESGTRTPLNPTPRTAAAARQPAPAAGQTAPVAPAGPGAAAAPATPAEPSMLEKFAARALIAVNAARAQAGALPLARNAALDTASALHAQYDVTTGQAEGNFQTRGTPLFLGETPSARVTRAAGSRGPVVDRIAEVMALGEAEPERAVQGWLDSVFHRVLLLDLAAQYAGFGQHTVGTATTAVLDLGGRRDVANASGWFPAANATEVPTRCVCDDFAEATGKQGPFGYPVTLLLGQVRPQGMPTIARLSEGTEDGPGVPAELVDAYGNPTLLPQAPLKPGTKYVVRLAWTNGPSVSWSFTTAGQ